MNEIGRSTAGAPGRQHIAGAEVVRLPHGRTAVTGKLADVAAALEVIRRTGRLISTSSPAPTGVPGHVMVSCKLAPRVERPHPVAAAPVRWTRSRIGWVASGAAAGLTAISWALYVFATFMAAHLAVIVVLALVTMALVPVGRRACTTIVKVTHRH